MGIASVIHHTAQHVMGAVGLACSTTMAASATRTALSSGVAHPVAQQARTLTLTATVHGYKAGFVVGSGMAFAAFSVAPAAVRIAILIAPPRNEQVDGRARSHVSGRTTAAAAA